MTETDPPSSEGPPVTPAPVPRPAVTFIACLFAIALVGHIGWDAYSPAYQGERVTFFLGVIVFAMLGYDTTKIWRRGGGDP